MNFFLKIVAYVVSWTLMVGLVLLVVFVALMSVPFR